MQQIHTETEYHQRRLSLESAWREKQLILDQKRRILRRWWLAMGMLIFLLIAGIIGGSYLNINLNTLASLAGISLIILLVMFLIIGRETLKDAWSCQGEIAEIKSQQKILEEVWIQGLAIQQYHEYYRQIIIPQVIEEYRRQSQVNRMLHLVFQLTIIVTSLLVTGLTSGLDVKLGLQAPWVAPVLSFVVSLFTAIMGFFKFRERSFHMQQTADYIEQEKTALELGIRHYKVYRNEPDVAFAEFAERVELSREEQRKRQQQLEQASDSKEIA
jgi:DNA-binding Lrp family transcriptional regulator